MNFSDVLQALNQASAFELFRMRSAIDRVLDEPQRMHAIHARLQIGQAIEYFDSQANALKRGTILELRRKQVLLLDHGDGQNWFTSYASINMDGADVQIREQVKSGLGRNEVAVGDILGYLDRNQRQRSGQVIRINDKSATLQVGPDQWRVAYMFLHRVLEVDAVDHNVLELNVSPLDRDRA